MSLLVSNSLAAHGSSSLLRVNALFLRELVREGFPIHDDVIRPLLDCVEDEDDVADIVTFAVGNTRQKLVFVIECKPQQQWSRGSSACLTRAPFSSCQQSNDWNSVSAL